MAESIESLVLRMRLDAAEVDAGTAAMLSKQRAAGREYVAMWEGVLAKKEALEKAELEASFSKYQANIARKLEADQAWMAARKAMIEEQAAIEGIGTTGGKYRAIRAGGSDASLFEGAAIGAGASAAIKGVSGEAHGLAGIIREIAVLFREGFRGNFTKMLGSFTLLLQYIGGLAVAVAAGVAAVTGISELFGGPGALKTWRAISGKNESQTGLDSADRAAAEMLRQRIEAMRKSGVLDKSDAYGLSRQLEAGNLLGVFDATNPLMGKQSDALKISAADKESARAQKELDEMNKRKEKGASLDRDILERKRLLELTDKTLAGLDKDSVDFHTLKADKLQQQVELQKLLNQQQTEANESARQQREETKQWHEWSQHAARDYMKGKIAGAMDEAEFPTMSDLAGEKWTRRLNRWYGAGGPYDLGRGNGPFAGVAQDYELAQKQQLWDRIHGNIADADQDRVRMVADRNYLVSNGVANPTMILSQIGENTNRTKELFESLVATGMIIKDP